jgi:hypothetical protein
MGIQRSIYAALKYYNDAKAISRAAEQRSAKPIVRRVGRRVYGKVTGRLARKIFG